jgi:hypothetical protein
MTSQPSSAPASPDTAPLRCHLTGRPLSADEAYWAQPLITLQALLAAIWTTLRREPGRLGQVLLAELPDVPYAPEAREQLARRRSAEQAKLLGLLLLLAVIIGGVVWALL